MKNSKPSWLRWTWGMLQLLLALFLFGFSFLFAIALVIPRAHLWIAEIPPQAEWQVSQGVLSYERHERDGEKLFLTEPSEKHLYTCRPDYSAQHSCFPEGGIEALAGKIATVEWFERKIYLWASQRHLVRLVVEGQEKVTPQQTEARLAHAKGKAAFLLSIFIFLVPVLLGVYLYKRSRVNRGVGATSDSVSSEPSALPVSSLSASPPETDVRVSPEPSASLTVSSPEEGEKSKLSKTDRRRHIAAWCFILTLLIPVAFLLFFVLLIPQYILWKTHLPPLGELHVSQGLFSYEKRERGPYEILFLTEVSGRHRYSCAATVGEVSECDLKSKVDTLAGKPATVWWFEQRDSVFSSSRHRRHLMRLVVDGQEEVSYQQSLERFSKASGVTVLLLSFCFLGILGVCVLAVRELRSLAKKPQNISPKSVALPVEKREEIRSPSKNTCTSPKLTFSERLSALFRQKDRSRRSLWGGRIGVGIFLFFFFLLPGGYLWTADIPPLEALNVSQGALSFKEQKIKGGTDHILNLSETGGKQVYTCREFYMDRHYCSPKSKIQHLEGKFATVWWFERAIYPWSYQRQLVRLVVDGQEEVSYEKSQGHLAYAKKFMFYATMGFLALLGFLMWLTGGQSVPHKTTQQGE